MESLRVADSFRVRLHAGVAQARSLGAHLTRFGDAARMAGVSRQMLDEFLTMSRARIAAAGDGFPRLEVWQEDHCAPELRLSLRPLPELGDSLALKTAPDVMLDDASVKGPNLARLTVLNEQLGAEALLLRDGAVAEGATTALLWWEGETWEGETLCTSTVTERVRSVTEAYLLDAARQYGVSVAARTVPSAALHNHEVWAVNALHGIRAVTTIDGRALPAASARLQRFRDILDRSWEPVLG